MEQDMEAISFAPAEGRANLYVVRRKAYFGSAITFRIMIDGYPIGSIGPGTWMFTARTGLEPMDEGSGQLLVMEAKRAISIWDY
jgi:hypothetical protein